MRAESVIMEAPSSENLADHGRVRFPFTVPVNRQPNGWSTGWHPTRVWQPKAWPRLVFEVMMIPNRRRKKQALSADGAGHHVHGIREGDPGPRIWGCRMTRSRPM